MKPSLIQLPRLLLLAALFASPLLTSLARADFLPKPPPPPPRPPMVAAVRG